LEARRALILFRSSSLVAVLGLLVLSSPGSVRAGADEAIAAVSAVSVASAMLCWTAAIAESRGDDNEDDASRKEYARRGAFAGAALAYAVETYESDAQSEVRDVANNSNLSVKNSFGFKGRLGYRCQRYVSAEVQVEWFDSFDGTVFQDGAGKIATLDFEPVVVTANGRGYIPLWNDRIQPFGLFGAGLATVKGKARDSLGLGVRASDRETEFALRGGGGVDFYVTPNIVVTFETDYVQAFGALDDFNYLSIGLGAQYRF
jgi:opacity protein-like surface antigen